MMYMTKLVIIDDIMIQGYEISIPTYNYYKPGRVDLDLNFGYIHSDKHVCEVVSSEETKGCI